MANTRLQHSRVKRPELIRQKVLDGVAVESLSTNTTYTAQLGGGEYNVSVGVWTENDGPALGSVVVKLKPFIDDGQTLVGKALFAHEIGSSTVASAITLSATSVAVGALVELVPDAGSSGARIGASAAIPLHHGLQILVDVNTNSGTSASEGDLNIELLARKDL